MPFCFLMLLGKQFDCDTDIGNDLLFDVTGPLQANLNVTSLLCCFIGCDT